MRVSLLGEVQRSYHDTIVMDEKKWNWRQARWWKEQMAYQQHRESRGMRAMHTGMDGVFNNEEKDTGTSMEHRRRLLGEDLYLRNWSQSYTRWRCETCRLRSICG